MSFDGTLVALASSAAAALSLGLYATRQRRRHASLLADSRRIARTASDIAESEARCRQTIQGMPAACMVLNPDLRIVEWNKAAETIFGWRREDIVGRNVLSALVPADALEQFRNDAAALLDNGLPLRRTLRHTTPDGRSIVCAWRHAVLRDAVGAPERIVSLCDEVGGGDEGFVGPDIADHRKGDAGGNAGSPLDERFPAIAESLLETIPLPVFYKDRQGRYLGFNRAYEDFFGATREELLGKTAFDISPRELAEIYRVQDESLFAAGGIQKYESRIRNAHGHLRDVIFYKSVAADGQGQPNRLIGVILDVTGLHKSHDTLRALALHRGRTLENERRSLIKQFHEDVAQHLYALRLSLQLFEHHGETERPRAVRDMIEMIDYCTTHVRRMVSTLRPAALDMGIEPALRWLADDFRKGVGLKFDLSLPDNDVCLTDEAATFLFRAAQEALINTSLHACAIRVQLSLSWQDDVCRLRIRDDGCGFDPAKPFREDAFGLLGMREQARHLGAELSIESAPNRGTSIEIRIPAPSSKGTAPP